MRVNNWYSLGVLIRNIVWHTFGAVIGVVAILWLATLFLYLIIAALSGAPGVGE